MLFSRIVEPPSRLSTEMASTAIGIDALTVSPARRPRYTVDAPNSRPNNPPSTIARKVNSAGDCDAGTYGWNCDAAGEDAAAEVVEGCAIGGGFYSALTAVRLGPYNRRESCENIEQTAPEPRADLGAHHESALDLPALSHGTRRCRRAHHLVAGPCRAVPVERCTDTQGSRLLRRVRRPRRRLLREGSTSAPAADPRARPQAARRDHGRGQPRPRPGGLSGLSPGRVRDRRALRCAQREGRPR